MKSKLDEFILKACERSAARQATVETIAKEISDFIRQRYFLKKRKNIKDIDLSLPQSDIDNIFGKK